jgi:hypothetical protein
MLYPIELWVQPRTLKITGGIGGVQVKLKWRKENRSDGVMGVAGTDCPQMTQIKS